MGHTSNAAVLARGTALDPFFARDAAEAKAGVREAEAIIGSEAFQDKRPVILSINPWRPRSEHVRLFAHLKHLQQSGGAAEIAIRRHLVGTDPSYIDTVDETLQATRTLLAMFGLRRVRVTNWDSRIHEVLLRKDFQTFLSKVDPQVARLDVRHAQRKAGLAEYWTTAADCFLAAEEGVPYVLSDAERAPYRKRCMDVIGALGIREPPRVLQLARLPKVSTPLLLPVGPDDWKASFEDQPRGPLLATFGGLVRPVDLALAGNPLRAVAGFDYAQADRSRLIDVVTRAVEEIALRFQQAAGIVPRRGMAPVVLRDAPRVDATLDVLASKTARAVLRCVVSHAEGATASTILADLGTAGHAADRATVFDALKRLKECGALDATPERPARYSIAGPALHLAIG